MKLLGQGPPHHPPSAEPEAQSFFFFKVKNCSLCEHQRAMKVEREDMFSITQKAYEEPRAVLGPVA